jgi:hypothetical protein
VTLGIATVKQWIAEDELSIEARPLFKGDVEWVNFKKAPAYVPDDFDLDDPEGECFVDVKGIGPVIVSLGDVEFVPKSETTTKLEANCHCYGGGHFGHGYLYFKLQRKPSEPMQIWSLREPGAFKIYVRGQHQVVYSHSPEYVRKLIATTQESDWLWDQQGNGGHALVEGMELISFSNHPVDNCEEKRHSCRD